MRLPSSHKLFLLLVVVTGAALVVLSFATVPDQSLASPTVGAPVAAPATISVGEPTDVTVTSQISTGPSDPSVISTSVFLQRLDTSNRVVATLGTMRDDGTGGDALAGDGVFTLRVTLTEPSPGEVLLRVSAAFRGLLRRVLSPAATLTIVQLGSLVSTDLGLSINYPAGWFVQQGPRGIKIANVQTPAPLSDASLASESFFEVRLIPDSNPNILPVDQWFDQHFSGGFAVPPISRATVVVNGRPAVRTETSEVGRWVHVYIPRGTDVIEVAFGASAAQFSGLYETMLQSIQFTP